MTGRVLAYMRVSTAEQADSGAGLAAQRAAIERESAHRGWSDVQWFEDGGYSGGSLDRPEMGRLIAEIRGGDVLVTAKVDRLSRSLVDFALLVERSQRERWSIVTLDLGLDLSTPQGEFVASILAAFARMERRLIGQRTRDAMQAKKAAGTRFGRSSRIPADVQEWVEALHAALVDAPDRVGVERGGHPDG
ncbi:MAG: recombinase family protein [Actinomycetota bacterium]|nr:recombinase family protein [Actinomycetota bacterium]